MKKLKEMGRLVHHSTYNHSYPFCWRSVVGIGELCQLNFEHNR